MLLIKKLDRYVFWNFLLLFLATFFICSFILLMQFLWKHINDIVGKGLDFFTLAEFFFYSSLTVVPLALPLAILLASLMTFGNMGEKMELTAMKAAGVSLFRIMAPLMVLIGGISLGAFFFSNNVLPVSQQKLWTLIFSLRQTSPELEIPVGEFYSEIDGYTIYTRSKDKGKKLLNDIMIYDMSKGFQNASVTVADSARMQMSEDKTFLRVILYNGEAFENLKDMNSTSTSLTDNTTVPYRRETFEKKIFLIDFDANFARMDENVMKDDYMSKDLNRLQRTIDSINAKIVIQQKGYASVYVRNHFFDRGNTGGRYINLKPGPGHSYEDLMKSLNETERRGAYEMAMVQMNMIKSDVVNQKTFIETERYVVIRHKIELQRKFTLSFACLIFFFIGAPLGAIIRKGGLGVPVVISVLLFIVYYIVDNTGFKLAREGVWEPWAGMWLSSVCLLPLGLLFTYKAAKDSPVFNGDAYIILFDKIKKLFKKKKT